MASLSPFETDDLELDDIDNDGQVEALEDGEPLTADSVENSAAMWIVKQFLKQDDDDDSDEKKSSKKKNSKSKKKEEDEDADADANADPGADPLESFDADFSSQSMDMGGGAGGGGADGLASEVAENPEMLAMLL